MPEQQQFILSDDEFRAIYQDIVLGRLVEMPGCKERGPVWFVAEWECRRGPPRDAHNVLTAHSILGEAKIAAARPSAAREIKHIDQMTLDDYRRGASQPCGTSIDSP